MAPFAQAQIDDNRQLHVNPAFEQLVDRYLAAYVASNNFSGTILLASRGEVLFNKGFGMSVFEHATPNTDETRYQIGSISKSFTVAAVLQLRESGELELHDPVSRFIPDFPRGDEMTVRDLMGHTSGLPRYVFFPDFVDRSQRQNSTQQLVDWLSDKPLVNEPGEEYNYSNANYAVLASIIERLSGQSYGTYIQLNILNPLALNDTGHRGNIAEIVNNLALSYVPVGLKELQRSRHFDYSVYTGAGSLYSTTLDLFNWTRALQKNALSGRDVRSQIANEPGEVASYAWIPEVRLDRDALVMRGWDGVGFSANITYFPVEDMTVIVLSNLNMSSITSEIVDIVASIYFGENIKYLELLEQPEISGNSLTEYTGVYRFGSDFYVPNSSIRVIEDGGQLLIPADSFGPKGGLLPISANSFIHRQQWIRVDFERAEDGTIFGMQYGKFKARKEIG